MRAFNPPNHNDASRYGVDSGVNRAPLWRLVKLIWSHYRFSLLVVVVCIGITSLTTLASTLFTRTLIDDYIVPLTQVDNPQYASLAQTLFTLALILLLGVVCSYLHSRLMINVSQGTMLRLRTTLFDHMQTMPVSFFDTTSHGKVMSTYTNDIDSLRQMIGSSLPQALNSLITITVTLASMIALSIPLTIVSLVMAGVMALSTTWLGGISRSYFKTQQGKLADLNGFVEEMVGGLRVVKVFNHETKAIEQFDRLNEQLRSATYNANRFANIVMPINGNLSHLSYVLIAVIGAWLILSGHVDLSLGTLVAFLTLNKSFARPITNVSQQVNSVLNASVGAERVFNLMDSASETDDGTVHLINVVVTDDGAMMPTPLRTDHWAWMVPGTDGGKPRFVRVNGGVRLSHVDFGYTPGKIVLHDINIEAMPDQKIAFVGGTGAGKTTITNLINRFYDTNSGAITLDGIAVKDIAKHHLRRALGMVLQQTHLFTGTVIDNIRYGRLDATDQDCIEAAKAVGADGFIRRLSNGYHTVLTDDGGNLSQGERQLLAIARAAVADPPLLILDEATSSIDTRTERQVQRGMDSLMNGRTTFVIAHRLSTVRNADCIIVLDHGRIIEQGNHDTLIEQRGAYYRLYSGGL